MKKKNKNGTTIGGIAQKISEGFYINIKRPPVHNLNLQREEDEDTIKPKGNGMPEEETAIEKTINPEKKKPGSNNANYLNN